MIGTFYSFGGKAKEDREEGDEVGGLFRNGNVERKERVRCGETVHLSA